MSFILFSLHLHGLFRAHINTLSSKTESYCDFKQELTQQIIANVARTIGRNKSTGTQQVISPRKAHIYVSMIRSQ